MYINQNNIVIRSAQTSHAKTLTQWWNDGEVMAHAGFPNGLGTTVEQVHKQIARNENRISQLCIMLYGEVEIGECHYRILDNDVAEIGIKICEKDYQNKGYGTQIIKMLVSFLFTDEKLKQQVIIKKIILDTNLNNKRAQHFYEKLGFTRLRVNHDAWEDQLGVMQSSVDYEMTRDDYEKLDY